MAVIRYAGDKVVCLSTDSFPSGIADGATLYTLDTKQVYIKSGNWTSAVGGNISINGITSNVNITGTGNISVLVDGTTIRISGTNSEVQGEANLGANLGVGSGLYAYKSDVTLYFKSLKAGSGINISGNTTELIVSNVFDSSNFATLTDLYNTGLKITALSGYSYPAANPQNYVTSGNLYNTGSILDSKINSLSGYSNLVFYPASNPQSYTTSGNLYDTGNILNSRITGLSGYSNSTFATITNVTATGTTLNNKINSVSGYANDTFYPLSNPQSYTTSTALASTGTTLQNQIFSIRNALVTGISISGSTPITGQINITGIGGTQVIRVGYNNIQISGGSTASAGVTSLNSLVNAISITGAGIVTAIIDGQTIRISGTTPTGAGEVNTASNLGGGIGVFSDKSIFDLRFNSISGGTGILATLSSNVIYINSTINTSLYALASNLESSGSSLNNKIVSLSGYSYPASNPQQYTTSGDLYSTGSNLNSRITSLSGYCNNSFYLSSNPQSYTTSGNLYETGNILNSRITSLSGYANNTFYLATNPSSYTTSTALASTGTSLQNQINSIKSSLVTGFSITGSNSITGKISITGVGNVSAVLDSNNVKISGSYEPTVNYLIMKCYDDQSLHRVYLRLTEGYYTLQPEQTAI